MDFSLNLQATASPLRRKGRYADLSEQEINMLLRQHIAPTAMAYFDALPAEERERVRDGLSVVKGETWRIQGRDAAGRFQSVSV